MTNGQIIHIKEGQLLTGRKQLSEGTGIPSTTVERILQLLEQTDSTSDIWRTSGGHLADTSNKVKNEKKVKNSSDEEDIQLDSDYAPAAQNATPSTKDFIRLFKGVNPSWLRLWLRPAEHEAAIRLMLLHSFEWWFEFMQKYTLARQHDKFLTKVSSPTQMEAKIGEIELYIRASMNSKKKTVIV